MAGETAMSIIVEARCRARQLLLEQPLNLPEGQRVRVAIEPIDDTPVGQQIVAHWRAVGVIGAWANRRLSVSSTRWARQLRQRASRRAR
jgi:predicted DNA-binding antitoxin AbrB/MazE fold protein